MHAITKISEKEKGLKIEKEREGENERGKIEKGREGSYTGTRIERSIKSGKGGKGEIGKKTVHVKRTTVIHTLWGTRKKDEAATDNRTAHPTGSSALHQDIYLFTYLYSARIDS